MRKKISYHGNSLSGLVIYLSGVVVEALAVQSEARYVTKVRPPNQSMAETEIYRKKMKKMHRECTRTWRHAFTHIKLIKTKSVICYQKVYNIFQMIFYFN